MLVSAILDTMNFATYSVIFNLMGEETEKKPNSDEIGIIWIENCSLVWDRFSVQVFCYHVRLM